jgi:uncharacterized damage-inducible protein DinB
MTTMLVDGVRVMIVRELETFIREIEMYPDDELMWTTPPGIVNSSGNLALHVSGNLQHFIGAVLGKSGYIRNRDVELGQRQGTRADVVAGLRRTIEVVNRVLPTVTETQLMETFPIALHGLTLRTDRFLLHLATHLAHHLGQAGYLRRMQTAGESSKPVPLDALVLS